MMTFSRNLMLIRPDICRITAIHRAQRGVTLVELMIAIVLGMLIMLALTTLYVNISRTNSEMAKTNALIENGRFAIQLLEGDIVNAGYWGGYVPQFDDMTITGVPTDAPTAVPAPCLAYNATNWNTPYKDNLIAIPIQSYADTLANCGITAETGTDVLVVRHVQTCVPGETNCEADLAGKLYFQPSFCETEIDAGNRYVLDTDTTKFILRQRVCGTTLAAKRKFISNIYYIGNVNGVPTLMRSSFDGTAHGTAVPLIEGIQGFRVELGMDNKSRCNHDVNYAQAISRVDPSTCLVNANPDKNTQPDNRGDGIPDEYVHCTTAGTAPCTYDKLANVVAVKLYVLARNKEATVGYTDTKTYTLGSQTLGPFNDHYKRHVFSTTVRLPNISGRRETP